MVTGKTRISVPVAERPRPRALFRTAGQIVVVIFVVVLLRAQVIEPVRVSSESMATTYDKGDLLLVDKLATRTGSPARGEIVTFVSPQDDALTLKRVVGVAGDRVALRDGYLFVNGGPVVEPFVDHASENATYFGPVTVPRHSVFVMGDNRANSIDSRNYGPVPLDAVSGRVRCRLWP
jgi:signal peptidase I